MLTEHSAKGWLIEPYEYIRPRRGQIRRGVVLKLEEQGAIVDVGLKRDGFVPRSDIERLTDWEELRLEPGQEVVTCIVRPRDRDGNLILSLYQARLEQDWTKAQEMLESGEIWRGEVTEYNRGGVLVKFGHLRAFVPASHLSALNRRHLSPDQRTAQLQECIGRELSLKVIEVDRHRRRLVLSERLARRHMRKWAKERLLNELVEGQVCRGTVCQLCDFGAFVDLKGADGLIHISELAWRRIRHPSEVLQVGDEIDVYVLRLDHERKRIGLSLKRLQPNPWDLVDTEYTKGQLLMGKVTNVVDFGAFVALDIGVQGLVHVSELADPPPDPRSIVQPGDTLVLRVLHINPRRHRIALSLKRVSAQERDEWLAQQSRAHSIEIDGASEEEEKTPPTLAHAAGALRSGLPGPMADRKAPAELAPALVESSEDEMYWISLAQDAPTKKES